MNFKRFIAKHYPSKFSRPTARGVVIAALFDFGWLWLVIAAVVLMIFPTYESEAVNLGNQKVLAIFLVALVFQFIALETLVWTIFYFGMKREIRFIPELSRGIST